MIQTPALVLSLILATAYAVAFLLWLGRPLHQLPAYALASILGFAGGQLAGERINLLPWTVGEVHILEATTVAFLFLLIMLWLKREPRHP